MAKAGRKPSKPPKKAPPPAAPVAAAPAAPTKETHPIVDAIGTGQYDKNTHYAVPKVFIDAMVAAQMSGRGMGQWDRIPLVRKVGTAFGENTSEGAAQLCRAMRDAHIERGVTV